MKVFVTRKIPENGIKMLQEKFEVEVYDGDNSVPRDILLQKATEVDAILSLLTDKIDDDFFKHAGDNLKIVANYAVGFDNFDLEAGKKNNVVMTNTPGVLTGAVAEFTIALMMSLTKRIPEADKFTKAGKYDGWKPMLLTGTKLQGKTLGLIGTGRIGAEVAKQAHAGLGMHIVYNDINPNDEIETKYNAKKVEKDDLLKQADVISLHVPLLDSTRHLISKNEFEIMKDTSYLINTARGPVIDEEMLLWALTEKQIAGAAIDVYEKEPEFVKGLEKFDNLIMTPHIGSATMEAREEMSKIAAENIIEVLEGREAKTQVN